MSPAELLREFSAKGVELWADGDRLRYRAPGNGLNATDVDTLRVHKEELCLLLRTTPESEFRATPGQMALWLRQQLEPRTPAYNAALALRIQSPVDVATLTRSVNSLAARHACLRSTFAHKTGELWQVVRRRHETPLELVPAAGWSDAEMRLRVQAAYRRPFDLEAGPLFRASLFSREPADHVLLLTVHHIACDAWSFRVMMDDLRVLYAQGSGAADNGTSASVSASFAEHAQQEREQLRGSAGEELWRYWQLELAGAPGVLPLATDYSRPATHSSAGDSVVFEVPEALLARLKSFARNQNATLYAVMLAGFESLLHRYTHERDFVVGSPTLGREDDRYSNVVGYFVNMVALRADLSGDPSFADLLARVRHGVLGALAHARYPLPTLLERLRIERDASRTPLFQVTFNLQQLQSGNAVSAALLPGGEPVDWGALRICHFDLRQQEGQFDLSLEMVDGAGRMFGVFKYRTELFARETMERMAGHFVQLLESAVAEPRRRVSCLQMLTAQEDRQIESWNATAGDYPTGRCLHEYFEDQAERTPDAPAIVWEDGTLTYREFNQRANQLARELVALGVKPESRVAVFAERSPEMMIAIYGVLKAGGAWVPVDPEYPADRVAFMIEDSGAGVILTQLHLLPRLAGMKVPAFALDENRDRMARHSGGNLQTGVRPGNLAYVIYTSGSTGRPKGAMNQHGGIVNRLQWMQEAYSLDSSDAVLQKTPISFDVSVWELFWPLWTGARLVLAKPGGHREPAYLIRRIEEERVTTIHFVPSMLETFAAEPAAGGCRSLRRVICSGEALSYELQERFFARLGCALHNLYGPTEAAVDVSYWACLRDSGLRRVPIGRPIANLRLEVLDGNGRRTPAGVPGELYIGGVGVGRGYQGRAALTAERFVPDGVSGRPGERLYRTGDQARWLADGRADGNIEYLGRQDSQVKLRGFRIELGEIEAALLSCAGIREAAAILRHDPPREPRLVAYVTGAADAAALRVELAGKLPEFMVPAAIVRLEHLPLNSNGKTDRGQLPAPPLATDEAVTGNLTGPEEVLAGIWCDVLHINRVGANDSFFSLGGHSLLVMQVLARIRKALQADLTVAQFFATPTVAGLAAAILPCAETLPQIRNYPRADDIPLSFAQRRMYFLHRLEPSKPFYNVPVGWFVEGWLDTHALGLALHALVERHGALRTYFVENDGAAAQRIADHVSAPLILRDLSGLGIREAETEARRLGNEDLHAVFDLSRAPLFRAVAIALPGNRHAISLVFHHIVCDGWTISLLSSELSALYRGFAAGEPASLPVIPIDYVDFTLWQREWMNTPAREAQLAYWRNELAGVPAALELPTDRPRPAAKSYAGATVFFSLSEGLSAGLKTLSRKSDATLFMVLLSGFAVLLSKYGNTQDVVIGTPVANRNRAELEHLAGVFVNSLPMRVRLDGDPVFSDLIAQVRNTALGAWGHQDLPFEALVDDLQPERSRSVTPVFQVLMVLMNTPPEVFDAGAGAEVTPFVLDGSTAKLDLNLTMRESANGIDAGLEYDSELFARETMERMAGHFVQLLESAVAEPRRRVSCLQMLTAQEDRQIESWNATAGDYPTGRCLHEYFEDQAERTPDAPAIVWEDGTLTYLEFNQRANQLARELVALGVKPESRVAVFAERSPEMMIAIYGVLKAGGAWVPVDPEYPADRVAFMIEDSGAGVILTQLHLLPRLAGMKVPAFALDENRDRMARHSGGNLQTGVRPGNLAYVIYTSGSTGRPKGAMNQHGGIVNRLQWMQEAYSLDSSDAVLQKTPISFDVSVWELFWPLWTGARLVLAKPGGHREPAYLIRRIEEERVTTIHFVPSMLETFAAEPAAGGCRSLRRVICSGEALSYELQERFFARLGCALHNLYGPTEAAVDVSYWACLRDSGLRRVPIGRPIANLRLEVLDGNGRRTPAGVPGELYIGGVGVGRGYQGRAALTAERFVPDGVSGRPGERLYRTGDQARWLADGRADGNIEYLGRQDSQVKLRGFRIELGEIEAALLSCAGIREAAAILRHDPPREPRLVAYVTGAADAAALRVELAGKLPEFMVPAAIVRLEHLPLNSNGKTDRGQLPASGEQPNGDAFLPPGCSTPPNEAEATLAAIWAELLNLPVVGIHDNFFFLGGDSIASMQVVARARRAGYELTVADMFAHQTVAELAAHASPARQLTATQESHRDDRPLTPIEHWFFARCHAEPNHFNQSAVFEIPADIEPVRLAAALDHLVQRHGALRSRFIPTGAQWRWAPSGITRFPFEVVTAPDPVAALAEHAPRLQSSLSLEDGQLMRAALFVAQPPAAGTPSRNLLMLVFHHLAMDGVSFRIVLEELEALYRETPLAPAPVSFQTWAEALERHGRSDAVAADASQWAEVLEGGMASCPRDFEGLNSAGSAAKLSLSIGEQATRDFLEGLPRNFGARAQDAFLAALATSLTGWYGSREVLVDVEGHGRAALPTPLDVSRTVGWFTSLYPVRLSAPPAGSTAEALGAARRDIARIPRNETGYGLLRYGSTDTLFAKAPEPEILFNYLGRFQSEADGWLRRAPCETGPEVSPLAPRSHLVEVIGYVSEGRLHFDWKYSSAVHRRETIERVAGVFLGVLQRIAADCANRASAVQTALDSYPLSPMQEGMLFETLLAPGKGVYWQQWIFELAGDFDRLRFEQAWSFVIARHEALRSTFRWDGLARAVQTIVPQCELPWDHRDWSELGEEARKAALRQFLDLDRHNAPDPSAAPLMRMALLALGHGRHCFVWSHHHLLLDGWSLGMVLADLLAAYGGLAHNVPADFRPAVPYRNYIDWVGRQDAAAAERFWRTRLSGLEANAALTAGRAASPDAVYETQDLRFTRETTEALQSQARRHRVTSSVLVQAAWALVLSRCSGAADATFGLVTATRPAGIPGVEDIVGVLINTIPVRIGIDREKRVSEWVGEIHRRQIELERYSYCSLAEIQAWSGLQHGESLFESVLVFENFPIDRSLRERKGPIQFQDVRIEERPHYPLLLVVAPGAELLIRFSHDSSRVSSAAVGSLAGCLRTVLEAMADSLDARVGRLPVLEDRMVAGARDQPLSAVPLSALFEAQADRTPDAVAVVYESRELSYRELDRRANGLAAGLQARGAGPDWLAGVCLERSVEMIVALLGVLKAGAAYVPLDPGYPAERLAFMLEDSAAQLVLTQDAVAKGGTGAQSRPHATAGPENLAYVIYTSGSSGKPKGVMQTHRAICNHMEWMQRVYPIGPGDRVLQKTPFSFDASVWEFYAPLLAGATLVMARPGEHQEPALLIQTIQDHAITILQLVPSQLGLLAAEEGFRNCTSLRRVYCGGEVLTPELQRRFFEALPNAELVNLYGPTETCVDSTSWVCDRSTERVPIGRPVDHTQVWILNRRFEPVPPGIRGELYLGGAGLARSYLRRPGMTAERFVPNPFAADSAEAGSRLYATGDLARMLPDGAIEYLGRVDSQVKLRGFRVEPKEIEAALEACEGVSQAAVIVHGDALAGFFTASPGFSPDASSVTESLRQKLPEHMIPGALTAVDAFPLSPSGKIDRQALAAIDPAAGAKAPAPAGDAFQTLLAEMFAEVLGADPAAIGMHDNFFERGGHSLLATQLVSRVRSLFSVDIRLRQFFETPTPASLGAAIRSRRNRGTMPPPIVRTPDSAGIVSFAQQRLWFLSRLQGAQNAYNIPAALRLHGPLNVSALEGAFGDIAERHEALRTTFHVYDGVLRQAVSDVTPFEIAVADVSSLPRAAQEQAIQQLMDEEGERIFSLETGPLLFATLLRLSAREHVLFLNWHHIASDGWSIGIFVREMAALYEARCGMRAARLPELTVQYQDFARWQREWLSGAVLAGCLDYWTRQLSGAPPLLKLPTDHLRPPFETWRGARIRFTLSPELHRQLRGLSRELNATVFMSMLAGFAVLLSRHSGQTDIVVGSPVANRTQAQTEGLIGVFVNTLALRVDVSGNPSFKELLKGVRLTALDAYTWQDLPFEQLVEAVQPERNLNYSPVFQVLFSMQTTRPAPLKAFGLTIENLDLATKVAKYDLSLYVTETPDELAAEFEYNTDLFEPATIGRMARQYERLLEQATAHPDLAVAALDILPDSQRRELLVQWNQTALEYDHANGPNELLRRAAARRPDSFAATCESVSLTYKELVRQVDDLAFALVARGVGPEVLVGLRMERGLDMLVTALAIGRAGAGYVPLDPAFPEERLRFMIADSGVQLVLTEASVADLRQTGLRAERLPDVQPDNLAYVIYTSGSTGRPKGVQVTRRNLANFLEAMTRQPGLSARDVLVSVTTLSFDIAALELYLPLAVGARVVIASRADAADGFRLLDLLRRSGATAMQATPATWRLLLEAGWNGDPALRVFCGGEAMPPDLAAKLVSAGLEVWNLYGPTETTIWSSVAMVHANDMVHGDDMNGATVPIGRPIANTTVYVLDGNLRPQPAGVPGDLYIGGDGVARGYLGRPGLTAQAFFPDPFSPVPGTRLYRTGDIARVLHDGSVECLGRIDGQIKLHGFRIETGEIETVLMDHPDVRQAVAAAPNDIAGRPRLIAWVVMKTGCEPDPAALRHFAGSRLPRYMVPAAFFVLDALPLTANGKVDRRALPAFEEQPPAVAVVRPSNETEEAIAAVWRGALNRDSFGIHDNFFDLGGHSLLLIKVQNGLRERLGVEVEVMELFEYPNIAALARHLSNGRERTYGGTGESATRAARRRTAIHLRKANA